MGVAAVASAAARTGMICWRSDIVAVASGRIVVSQRSKLIQRLETSVVRAIHVKDRDRVREGQLRVDSARRLGPASSARAAQAARSTAA